MSAPKFDPKAEWALGMPACGYTHAVMAGGYCVADIMECSGHEERNARLIVAAPKMYAALLAIAEPGCQWDVQFLDDAPDGRCHRCSPCVARDALAKAEGVQP